MIKISNLMKNYVKNAGIIALLTLGLASCSDENDTTDMQAETYDTTFKITDAPIDNANVEAVFVTIANVKVDGNAVEGFSKTTVELSSLVNGKSETLGNLALAAGSYSNIVLELDYETDAAGNTPGTYVALANGTKDKLEASAKSITINDAFDVFASATNQIVIDFDLRKTIKEEEGNMTTDFNFVTMSELTAGIRTVNEETTGMISGTANDAEDTSDKIIVYAYEEGTFNAETEMQGSGESGVKFANAVTSSVVSNVDSSYSLNFLKEGDYELVFASYKEEQNELYFNALLEVESALGIDLGAISITSAIHIDANVTVKGTK